MPAIRALNELFDNVLVHRSTIANSTLNSTAPELEVICAWPVSGQYGPGTRVLYYALVAACVFARKTEWIRNACLAAALLFPAVAALHGIVLATLHRNGAVDMDVYGAFQLCTIGILTAPVTVRLSNTYFNNTGRDIIFLWTGLLLAGLLSLTVEFIRSNPTVCPPTDLASIEWARTGQFSYGSHCSMVCGPEGPFSPLRRGASNNIYVIPVPYELTFATATLLSAACCIPAILSLVSTWIKIMEKNWEKLSGREQSTEKPEDQPITGTNGATPKHMTRVADRIRGWLTLIEIPVFVAAVLAILIKGEMNFFSNPVNYGTEPMTSIGQWAPIVGTGLAAVGSLYLLLAADMEAEEKQEHEQEHPDEQPPTRTAGRCTRCDTCIAPADDAGGSASSRRSSLSHHRPGSTEIARTATRPSVSGTFRRSTTNQSEQTVDVGGRRKVARILNMASKQLAAKTYTQFNDSGFNPRGLTDFPEIPGEMYRNKNLPEVQKAYSNTPIPRSRASSFIGSIRDESPNGEGSSRKIQQNSQRNLSLPVTQPPRVVTRQRQFTFPARQDTSFDGICHQRSSSGDVEGEPSSRQRSSSGGSKSGRDHASRTPSIPEVSPTHMVFDKQDTSPKIVVSTP